MTPDACIRYCLQKPGAYIDHPFGPDSTILKVEKKIFAQFFVLKGQEMTTLKCDMMTGQFYRQLYPGIILRGYHCPPVQQPYFNSFPLDGRIPDAIILEMIDHSYSAVVHKLPGYIRNKLET